MFILLDDEFFKQAHTLIHVFLTHQSHCVASPTFYTGGTDAFEYFPAPSIAHKSISERWILSDFWLDKCAFQVFQGHFMFRCNTPAASRVQVLSLVSCHMEMLYMVQISDFKIEPAWPWRDLNTQPSDLESDALPLRHGVTWPPVCVK